MAEGLGNQPASRSAWLDLKEELRLVNDGYEFLDEKAILLAAEMLQQRDDYRDARDRFMTLAGEAAAALRDAAADQGLDGLQVYPATLDEDARIEIERRSRIGLSMLDARYVTDESKSATVPVNPSSIVENCRHIFASLIEAGTNLAAITANLERLIHEFRRTSRRVRALENVVLPELRDDLAAMEEHLDLIEQEEVIRVRSTRPAIAD